MDILKILSRGAKKIPRKAGDVDNVAPHLPSASRPIPQLYHDDVGSSGKKRKRDKEEDEVALEEELSDMDFFAPKVQKKPAAEASKLAKTIAPQPQPQPSQGPVTLLDEDECRQMLRSHRLKLTVLSSRSAKQSNIRKSKKKKAGKKDEAKKDKRQLHPQPLNSFSELRQTYGISPRLAENLERLQYRIPTEVQIASLPLLLNPEVALRRAKDRDGLADIEEGVDFLAVAPTGSGKTLCFLIPAINGIMRRKASSKANEKQHILDTIIVAPTRELALQITNEGKKLTMGTGVRVVAMKKGMKVMTDDGSDDSDELYEDDSDDGMSEDEDEVEEEEKEGDREDNDTKSSAVSQQPLTRADILVTTPMLLLNYLEQGSPKSKKIVPTVSNLVLDEADVLLDPLFRNQAMGIWKACRNPALQVSFWSATVGSNTETLLTDQLSTHARSSGVPPRPLVRLVVGLKDTAVPNIAHKLIYTATEQGKLLALRQLLHPTSSSSSGALRPPFLVFVQTVDRATALHAELRYDIPAAAGGAARLAVLHSGLPDAARAAVLRRFRAAEVWVLVTTDVLARGVDFAGVNAVVNYDVPGSAAAYVHRAGRTGRAGRRGGVAVTLYTRDDIPFVKSVANVIAASERQASAGAGGGATHGGGGGSSGVQQWLLDALPDVAKADRKKLRERGVESRRSGGAGAKITSKSAWERRRDHNRRGAIEASKRRKAEEEQGGSRDGEGDEWGGIDD